jgi:hypothetical protein
LSISVRLRNLIKRRPRPDMGWSAAEEEEINYHAMKMYAGVEV